MLDNIKVLGQFAIGEKGQVVGYDVARSQYRQKLLAMGLTPGTSFQVTRVAPLGCPIEVAFRGYSLSLRKEEIDILQVKN